MHLIFINHSLVDGHLSWLHFLAVVNRTAVEWVSKFLCNRNVSYLDFLKRMFKRLPYSKYYYL